METVINHCWLLLSQSRKKIKISSARIYILKLKTYSCSFFGLVLQLLRVYSMFCARGAICGTTDWTRSVTLKAGTQLGTIPAGLSVATQRNILKGIWMSTMFWSFQPLEAHPLRELAKLEWNWVERRLSMPLSLCLYQAPQSQWFVMVPGAEQQAVTGPDPVQILMLSRARCHKCFQEALVNYTSIIYRQWWEWRLWFSSSWDKYKRLWFVTSVGFIPVGISTSTETQRSVRKNSNANILATPQW